MTTYRILPDGRRRALPDGTPRAVGQAGPASTALTPGIGEMAFAGAAAIVAIVALSAAPAEMAFAGTAQLSVEQSGQTAHGEMTFGGSARLTADAYLVPAVADTAFTGAASITAEVPLSVEVGTLSFDGSAVLSRVAPLVPVAGSMEFGGSAKASAWAVLKPAIGTTTFSATAKISVSQAALWRSRWLNVYATRQAVLNAIDAHNRFLAKQAGIAATANANAIIATNTRVTTAEGRITAEAERITLLTAEVEGIETATGNALQSLNTTVTQQGNSITANTTAITAANTAIAGKASQSSVDTLTSTVTAQGNDLTAKGQQITSLQGELAGKASSTALASLSTTVSQQGDQISAQGTQLSSVSATVGNQSATITQIMEATASTASGNLLPNPSFETAGGSLGQHWQLVSGEVFRVSSPARSGSYALQFNGSGTVRSTYAVPTPNVGQTVRLGFHVRTSSALPNGNIRIWARWLNASGGLVGNIPTGAIRLGSEGLIYSFQVHAGAVTVPQGAASLGVDIISTSTTGNWVVDDVFVEPQTEGVTQALAKVGLYTDVNDNIAGWESINDGIVSQFNVLADVFRIIGGPTEGMEWRPGYLRVYGPGYQSIMGYQFGAAGEGMVRWFGPNVGAANATRANGTIWEAKDGTAYFGGQVLQGILRAFNSNTTVSAAAEVATGAISSKNTPVAVTGRLRYSANQSYPAHNSVATLTNGATLANVVLERRYRNAADTAWEGWATLATDTIPGTASVQNESDGPSFVRWNIGGDVLATDVASVRKREYRLRLTGLSRQNHTVTNPGTIPALVQNQYQSIESME